MKVFDYLQAFITVVVLGTWVFLTVTGKTVPDTVFTLVGAVVGYFFHSSAIAAEKRIAAFIEARKQDERID